MWLTLAEILWHCRFCLYCLEINYSWGRQSVPMSHWQCAQKMQLVSAPVKPSNPWVDQGIKMCIKIWMYFDDIMISLILLIHPMKKLLSAVALHSDYECSCRGRSPISEDILGNCHFNCAVTRITKAGPTVPIYVDHVLFLIYWFILPTTSMINKRIGCQALTKLGLRLWWPHPHPTTRWSMGAFGRLGWFWSTTLASLVDRPWQEVTWAPPYTQHRPLEGLVHPCKFDLTNSRRPAAIAKRPWRRRKRWLRLAWAPSSRSASLNMTPSLVSIEEA